MKLTARDMAAFLKAPNKQAKALLLFGPDTGLVRERSRQIAHQILGANPDPFNKVELTGDQIKSDPALLHDSLCAMTLMGGERIVILRDLGDKQTSVIAEAFNSAREPAFLVAEAAELTPSSSLRQMFEREKDFAALACYHDDGRDLEEVIRNTLQSLGKTISREALSYLVDNFGNDRGVTQSELHKIALYLGADKEVTLATAIALTGNNAAETMDDFCYAVTSGDAAEAELLLGRLLHEGTQPVAIVRSMLRHVQRLDLVQAHMSDGSSQEQAMAALRPQVFYKYAPLMKRALGRLTSKRLAAIERLLLKTETDLKSSVSPPALQLAHAMQYCARLAG